MLWFRVTGVRAEMHSREPRSVRTSRQSWRYISLFAASSLLILGLFIPFVRWFPIGSYIDRPQQSLIGGLDGVWAAVLVAAWIATAALSIAVPRRSLAFAAVLTALTIAAFVAFEGMHAGGRVARWDVDFPQGEGILPSWELLAGYYLALMGAVLATITSAAGLLLSTTRVDEQRDKHARVGQ